MFQRHTLLACLLAAFAVTGAQAQDKNKNDRAERMPFQVKLLGFNDYHGNLLSPGTFGVNTAVPAALRPAVGGADFLAAEVARRKALNPLHVVVGAGDFIGATPLVSALFHDEPAVETLNRIGMDFSAVGNHEFDKGAAELLRLQKGGCKIVDGLQDPNSCKGATVGTPVPFEGAKFKWLSANVINNATGKPLLRAYGLREFKDVKVAFIGMTLAATPTIVTPSGVAGLTFQDEADTVNALIPKLRREGVRAIVVLVHQGGFQSAGLSDINGCDGNLANSEIAKVVARLDNEVDLVVSGHTHAAYNCSAGTVDAVRASATSPVVVTPRPTGLPNAAGRLIPVTSSSAFGRVLTDVDLTIDPVKRDIVAVTATNRLVDRTDPELIAAVAAKPEVTNLVTAYNGLVAPIANQVIGSITTALPNAADPAGNMPAGELIADSQLAATAPVGFGEAVIAFMNPGGVRNPGFTFPSSTAGEGDGNVTYGEAFTVQPFGNSLVTLTLSAQQIKDLLEQQFVGCRGQGTQRILIPSAGFKYTWNSAAACDSRISDVRLVDANGTLVTQFVDAAGVVVDATRTFRVTVNNFLATGGDGFTTLLGGTQALGGAQDIDALTAYLASFRLPATSAYDPTATSLQKPRITRLP
ncbi:bifunctional metallophosphatase/5'-nucleotidase [Leptothrix discophora]|uniref:Bifunctional metallophosphatase/5'-nucleotidase n=1 Tax=Leptothrix discophora TaxID=89 RepID=A0ABT9G7K0_LEPDI|nr:bifunctional metallophosphatase/5'-nucleotidase [Leptothrix discophora]MDP4302451.1 bifunctional metallophosphatase/5'-nucleotidase [Leptothrix discophora]